MVAIPVDSIHLARQFTAAVAVLLLQAVLDALICRFEIQETVIKNKKADLI